jgi:hypothetical protein
MNSRRQERTEELADGSIARFGLTCQSDYVSDSDRRVDNVYGDRNLLCSCPPVADYVHAAE